MLQYFYMDPTSPTIPTPEVTNQTPPTPVSTETSIPEVKNNSWMTTAAMAVFVLLALSAVAFLYYQNQQLKAMVVLYQAKPSATPVVTITPVPIIESSSSGNPTASSTATSSATPTMSPLPITY